MLLQQRCLLRRLLLGLSFRRLRSAPTCPSGRSCRTATSTGPRARERAVSLSPLIFRNARVAVDHRPEAVVRVGHVAQRASWSGSSVELVAGGRNLQVVETPVDVRPASRRRAGCCRWSRRTANRSARIRRIGIDQQHVALLGIQLPVRCRATFLLILISSSNRPLLLKSIRTTCRFFPSSVMSPSRYAAALT